MVTVEVNRNVIHLFIHCFFFKVPSTEQEKQNVKDTVLIFAQDH